MTLERSALLELTIARVKEALRDPTALFWTFVFPIFLAIVLGLAFRATPGGAQRVALVCSEPAAECAALSARLSSEPQIGIQPAQLAPALHDLGRGKLELVLELVHAAAGARPTLTLHFDPSRKEAHLARLAIAARLGQAPPELELRERPYTERGGRYIDFLMPGIVALNLMGSGVWGIGLSIVDQRRRRLIRQLATTPMRRGDYLLSYMLSRLVFLVPEVAFLFGFGVLAFGTPLRGSMAAIALLSLLGAFAFTGLGVLIGARTASVEAAAGWANFVMMPMWLFSGVFFSYELFPARLLPAIRALPLTALTDALRAVTNDAAPLSACAGELGVLGLWTALSFALALRTFRWQ